jgi:hypothetical protein
MVILQAADVIAEKFTQGFSYKDAMRKMSVSEIRSIRKQIKENTYHV